MTQTAEYYARLGKAIGCNNMCRNETIRVSEAIAKLQAVGMEISEQTMRQLLARNGQCWQVSGGRKDWRRISSDCALETGGTCHFKQF